MRSLWYPQYTMDWHAAMEAGMTYLCTLSLGMTYLRTFLTTCTLVTTAS